MRNHLLSLSIVALIGLGLADVAIAASTPTQTQTVPLKPTNSFTPLTFTKFDPDLGTLNSIDIFLSGHEEADGTVSAIGRDGSYTFRSTTQVTQFYAGGRHLNDVLPSNTDTQVLGSGGSPIPYAYAHQSGDASIYYTLSSAADLASFTGPVGSPGTLDLVVFIGALSSITGPGSVTNSISTSGGAVSSVTYNYTPAAADTPEPGALAILAAGSAMGAALLRRRRALK